MSSVAPGRRMARLRTMTGMAGGGSDLVVRLAPVAQLRLGVGTVAVEGGTKLERRHFGARIQRIAAGLALSERRSGQQKRRYCEKNGSHDSSTSTSAHTGVRGKRRANSRAPRSVRHQSASGGRSRPSGWTPGGGNCEKKYSRFEDEDGIGIPAGPAIEADAQQAAQGPQCDSSLPPSADVAPP